MGTSRILIVHPDGPLGAGLKQPLAAPDIRPVCVDNVPDAVRLLEGFDFDAVIVDRRMLDFVIEAIEKLRAASPHVSIVIVDPPPEAVPDGPKE